MTEILTLFLIVSAILGYALYEAKRRIAQLQHALEESEKKVTDAGRKTVISDADLQKRAIAVY